MSASGFDERVEAVRRFNRFHTRRIGVLEEGLLQSPFSLTEARLLYELAHHESPTAAELSDELSLDAGYVSRILGRFEEDDLIERTPSEIDRREIFLSLTERGRDAFAELDAASRERIGALLQELPEADQRHLVRAMETIREVLGDGAPATGSYVLREPRPGDMGWVVQRHGELYAREYGWNEDFEALVARIVADFMETFDRRRERCWIAEREGENVGCVFLVRHPEREGVARLRLLLVEPRARGLGIGSRLVDECVSTARELGYERITLWTNAVLHAARRIYERCGFCLVREEPHRSFGDDLVGQHWDLEL